jgi:Cu(I)/Ag(I) efflux system periplasmic protein CusF
MKAKLFAAIFTLLAGPALAQSDAMKGMDMKGMEKKEDQGTVHKATGVVTKIDKNKVTIKHEPVASISWPAMTMAFVVKDKALMPKLAKDKKVDFEFVQQGKDYVVTSVK